MGGLLAAWVLADFYHTVTVVERDVLPVDVANRREVPQGRHGHVLLTRGSQVLGELFPGLLDELVAAGAPVFDDGNLSKLSLSFGGHRLIRSGAFMNCRWTTVYYPSRPLLEAHVRQRLRAVPNVTILDGHDVVKLTSTADRNGITGARVVNRDDGGERALAADLVVDAAGRGARTPAFLESLGYGRPVEDHIVIRLVYTSQLLRIPPGVVKENVLVVAPVPGRLTGGAFFGYENGTAMLTLGGMMGREPPIERAEMLSFAEEFAPAAMLAALRAGEPLGDVARYSVPSNQWRRYDKMRRFPDGLLVFGDAICSFNPLHAQGMTVSAQEAVALADCLRRGERDLAQRFFRTATKRIRPAWQMAIGADLALPDVQGPRSLATRLTNSYTDRVLTAAESDTVVSEKFFRVVNLVDPPTRLLHPSVVFRIATANRRRRLSGRHRGRAVSDI